MKLWPKWVERGMVDLSVPGSTDLMGRPGTMTEYLVLLDGRNEPGYDCCCPGCGNFVACLNPLEIPLGGPLDGKSMMNRKPIKWFCCGWTGRLSNGFWVFDWKSLPGYMIRQLRHG